LLVVAQVLVMQLLVVKVGVHLQHQHLMDFLDYQIQAVVVEQPQPLVVQPEAELVVQE
jgi:hypothetical protein